MTKIEDRAEVADRRNAGSVRNGPYDTDLGPQAVEVITLAAGAGSIALDLADAGDWRWPLPEDGRRRRGARRRARRALIGNGRGFEAGLVVSGVRQAAQRGTSYVLTSVERCDDTVRVLTDATLGLMARDLIAVSDYLLLTEPVATWRGELHSGDAELRKAHEARMRAAAW